MTGNEALNPEIVDASMILMRYSAGEITLEQANEELKEIGSTIVLDPNANVLTEEEVAATTVGETPAEANGWGLLDTGTGYKNKVEVRNGKLVNAECGNMFALLFIGGKMYEVQDTTVVEYTKKAE